ncbi:unnamed protein product [Caenorhabditis sp. 36 PRJEB53466]|nr:unnamed protein product [Caenorhabditis sp. 36 PRJEB53466]
MTKLDIEEEIELCHYHFKLPEHSFIFFGFWSVFIIIIVLMTQFSSYSEPIIPWDNCDLNTTWEPVMRTFINKEQYKSEMRKIVKFREKNNMYRKNNYSRIEYGTTELSYCKTEGDVSCDWVAKRAEVTMPEGILVKSITRTIELDPYFSSGLRFLVMECMSFRMTLALIRTADVLTSTRIPLPRFVQFVLSGSPFFSFLQSLSLFWITALHSEFDIDGISFFHPYAYLFVGIFTFLEMFIDLTHDAFDGRFVFIQKPRFYIKTTCFIAFSACFPQVVLNWLQFFNRKTCHAYVPLVDGMFEYTCAFSMISYHFINAQMPVQMYITPTVEDVRNVTSFPKDIYSPAFQSDKSVQCESLGGSS